jgi:hypothetical protein
MIRLYVTAFRFDGYLGFFNRGWSRKTIYDANFEMPYDGCPMVQSSLTLFGVHISLDYRLRWDEKTNTSKWI